MQWPVNDATNIRKTHWPTSACSGSHSLRTHRSVKSQILCVIRIHSMRNNAESVVNRLLWQDSQPTERAMHIADAHVVGMKQGRAKVELLDFRLGRQMETN